MAKKIEDWLKQHSPQYVEMAFRPPKQGPLADKNGYGMQRSDCGDKVEIFINVVDDTIERMGIQVRGCQNILACANAALRLSEGKSVAAAWALTPQRIAGYIETLPEDRLHCAELVVGAMRAALENYRQIARAPWKKMYAAT